MDASESRLSFLEQLIVVSEVGPSALSCLLNVCWSYITALLLTWYIGVYFLYPNILLATKTSNRMDICQCIAFTWTVTSMGASPVPVGFSTAVFNVKFTLGIGVLNCGWRQNAYAKCACASCAHASGHESVSYRTAVTQSLMRRLFALFRSPLMFFRFVFQIVGKGSRPFWI